METIIAAPEVEIAQTDRPDFAHWLAASERGRSGLHIGERVS